LVPCIPSAPQKEDENEQINKASQRYSSCHGWYHDMQSVVHECHSSHMGNCLLYPCLCARMCHPLLHVEDGEARSISEEVQ
jgi:hypothetical protein